MDVKDVLLHFNVLGVFLLGDGGVLVFFEGADEGEEDWQEDESVGDSKYNDSEPHSEEYGEDVAGGEGKREDGEEGTGSAVKDGGTHLGEGHPDFLDPDL